MGVETFKKAVGSQFGDSNKKKIMMGIMKEVQNVKNSIENIIDELPSKEELHSLKETNKDLEERLLVANTAVENLKSQSVNNNYIEDDDEGEEVGEEEVANVSVKLEAVSKLLEEANSALLSQTGIDDMGIDMSIEPESDVSGWQLDLEGIQLGGWQQRLANYSKKRLSGHGQRSAFPTELSRSPVPGTQMWQSLYRKLEDLDKVSEVTFDLVQIAVESTLSSKLVPTLLHFQSQGTSLKCAMLPVKPWQNLVLLFPLPLKQSMFLKSLKKSVIERIVFVPRAKLEQLRPRRCQDLD